MLIVVNMKHIMILFSTIIFFSTCVGIKNKSTNTELTSDSIFVTTDNPDSDLMDYLDDIPSEDIQIEDSFKI